MCGVPGQRRPAYHGALPLVGLASAALIVGLQADGPAKQVLGTRPFVGLGKISYGVYLYHWPVFVLLDRQGWAVGRWGLLALKLAITLAVAMVSYCAGEAIRGQLAGATAPLVALGAAVMAGGAGDPRPASTTGRTKPPPTPPPSTPGRRRRRAVRRSPAGRHGPTIAGTDATGAVTTTTGPLVPPRPVRIAIVGDSTAEALGAGMVAWAAANPSLAQVEVVAGAGCGLSNSGYLVFDGLPERDVAAECGPYLHDRPPADRRTATDPVMLITTWTPTAAWKRVARYWHRTTWPPWPRSPRASGMTDTCSGCVLQVWVTEPIRWWACRAVGSPGRREPPRGAARIRSLAAANRRAWWTWRAAAEQGLRATPPRRTPCTGPPMRNDDLHRLPRPRVREAFPLTVIHTDGACAGSGPGGGRGRGAGRFAAAPAVRHHQPRWVAGVLEALRADGDVTIVSDSTYVVNCFRDRWWVK